MRRKELKSIIIATIVMIAIIGALCIATPAMAEEDIELESLIPMYNLPGIFEMIDLEVSDDLAAGTYTVEGETYLVYVVVIRYTSLVSPAIFVEEYKNKPEFENSPSRTVSRFGTVTFNGHDATEVRTMSPTGDIRYGYIWSKGKYVYYLEPGTSDRLASLELARMIGTNEPASTPAPTPAVEETPVEEETPPPLSAGEMWTPKTGDIPSSPLAISGCDELDQHLLRLYDHNHNGLIDEKEMVYASLDYGDNRMLQRDFRQIEYAYEHQCVVIGSGVPEATPIETPTPTPIQTPTPAESKFRVAPTVKLRPVNDVIDTSQDGLVELYMNNPSLNDVTLTADVQVAVPSGIHISGDGFGYGAAAGTVAGKFTVPPGTVRTININIQGEKTGVFTIHFTGLYWADDNKDAFQQVSLTHQLTVTDPDVNKYEPSIIETNTPSPYTEPINNTESNNIPTTYIVIGLGALVIMLIIIIAARK